MTQVGEGIAVTQVKDPEEDHWAQLEYTYPDGSPVQGMFTAVDGSGMTWTGYLNDQGQACLSGLPAGSVEYQLLPSDSLEDELQELRIQIKTVLDGIIEEQRAEAKAHQEELDKQSTLGKTYSHTAAVGRGLWNGAIGLLTFVKDVAVKAGEVAVYLSPVTRMNNLLQASYTSYRNGELNWAQWRESLAKNYQEEEFKDLAELLGIDIRNLDKEEVLAIITEAYETVAYIADDAEFRELFIQFGKDYAGAQSSIEWAEFAGGGLFEIVLTALLLAFTGGLGNAAQIASKVRHAARLRTLGGMLRKLGKLLQRKKLNRKTTGGVDAKHKVQAEKPEGPKLGDHKDRDGSGAEAPKRERPEPNGFEGPNGYKTHGISEDPMASPEGRALVQQYEDQGLSREKAVARASTLMESGSTYPKRVQVAEGERLYKVVPEGSMPGANSAFFATEKEISTLRGKSFDEISDGLGIPLESQQTTKFDVVEVTAKKDFVVFESVVAPTTQNGYAQPGGAIQTLITDRSAFSDPKLTGIKLP